MGTNLSLRRVAKLSIAVAVGLPIVAAAIFVVIHGVALQIRNSAPFDPHKWRAGDVRLRGQMVDDLEDSGILIAKTREQVIEVLGPPDRNEPTMLAYTVDLGHKFGTSPWYYSLVIGLGPEGRVRKMVVVD